MELDFQPLIKAAGKAWRIKPQFERLEANRKRIYELSRELPNEEGFELTKIYEQSLEDAKHIVKVANEK